IVKSLIIALVAFKGQASEQLEDRLVYHIKNKASYYRWKRVYWNKERNKETQHNYRPENQHIRSIWHPEFTPCPSDLFCQVSCLKKLLRLELPGWKSFLQAKTNTYIMYSYLS